MGEIGNGNAARVDREVKASLLAVASRVLVVVGVPALGYLLHAAGAKFQAIEERLGKGAEAIGSIEKFVIAAVEREKQQDKRLDGLEADAMRQAVKVDDHERRLIRIEARP